MYEKYGIGSVFRVPQKLIKFARERKKNREMGRVSHPSIIGELKKMKKKGDEVLGIGAIVYLTNKEFRR